MLDLTAESLLDADPLMLSSAERWGGLFGGVFETSDKLVRLSANLIAAAGPGFWMLVGIAAIGLTALSIVGSVYLPRRRRQQGSWYATVASLFWSVTLVTGTALAILTAQRAVPFRWAAWFGVVVCGALLLWRVIDYVRFRMSLPAKDERGIEFGKGAPFLNRTEAFAQLASLVTLFATTLIRYIIRLIENPDPLVLSLFGLAGAWIGLTVLFNRRTPWFVNQQGLSVWGRPMIEWPEFTSYRWHRDPATEAEWLVMTLDEGDEIDIPLVEHRPEVTRVLKQHLGSPESVRVLQPGSYPHDFSLTSTTYIRYLGNGGFVSGSGERIQPFPPSPSGGRLGWALWLLFFLVAMFIIALNLNAGQLLTAMVLSVLTLFVFAAFVSRQFARTRIPELSTLRQQTVEPPRKEGMIVESLSLIDAGVQWSNTLGARKTTAWHELTYVVHDGPWLRIFATNEDGVESLAYEVASFQIIEGNLEHFVEELELVLNSDVRSIR